MEANKQLIEQFYQSFAKGDYKGMVECYHDDIVFEDPAFGVLKGRKVKAMWQMLVSRNKGEIKIHYSDVSSNNSIGAVNWKAEYVFKQTGRPVVNHITAKFEFKDGKIIKHTDYFNLWLWSRQALGFKGVLLGWTPFMKTEIQQSTNQLLASFMMASS